MRKTSMVFLNAIKRGRVYLLLGLVAGILLCLVFHLMTGVSGGYYDKIALGFHDEDVSGVSGDLRWYLEKELGIKLMTSTDLAQLDTALVEKNISGIVQVPKGFEDSLLQNREIPLVLTFLDDYANAAFVQGYIESYTASLQVVALGAGGDKTALHSLLQSTREKSPELITSAFDEELALVAAEEESFSYTVGFFLMVSFLLVMALSNMLFDDRKKGLFQRVKVSSVQTWQYIAGMCAMGFIGAITIVAVVLGYIWLTGASTGVSLLQTAGVCLLYALVIVSIALVVALYLPTRNSIMAAIVGGSTVTCLLGGAYFPIETAPETMQMLARLTPQFWVMDTIKNHSAAGHSYGLSALILLLFALLCLILAGIRYASSSHQAKV